MRARVANYLFCIANVQSFKHSSIFVQVDFFLQNHVGHLRVIHFQYYNLEYPLMDCHYDILCRFSANASGKTTTDGWMRQIYVLSNIPDIYFVDPEWGDIYMVVLRFEICRDSPHSPRWTRHWIRRDFQYSESYYGRNNRRPCTLRTCKYARDLHHEHLVIALLVRGLHEWMRSRESDIMASVCRSRFQANSASLQ